MARPRRRRRDLPDPAPGRENRLREPHYGTYEELAEQLVEALLPHFDRPFAFFGHCGGALPGFATALLLARSGLPTPGRCSSPPRSHRTSAPSGASWG
ncbi:thioesterase II family protein [Streptomyces stramineus]